jgi:pyruvate dehydrogenase E2 component (dihydrolipoamide acetyltransferase)
VVALVGEGASGASAPKNQAPAAAKKQATAPTAKSAAADGAADSANSAAESTAQPGASGAVTGGTEVVMPQMGESIFEGTITKWLKKVGDSVNKDEPLFEISTDKVDAEIPAPIAGTLTEIKAPEGATVQINTVVAVIGGSAVPAPKSTTPGAETKAAAPQLPEVEAPAVAAGTTEKLRSSPLVRRIAKDHNLDLRQMQGTGAGGRITRDDALKFLANNGAGAAAPAKTAATSAAAASTSMSSTPVSSPLPGTLVPLTKMRSIIAQRMVESAHTSPHVHTVFKVDMTRIAKLREKEKAKYEQRNGVKLTYMPFIASAAVQTLRKFPIVNASLEETASGLAIRYHQNINLGIAVALEWGLIVPVIKQAEERSFLGLARAVADLAERARGKKLKPDEVSGSTFTLTNSGIFGEEFGTPIINQPDSAILAIGGLKKEPVVMTDAEGNDTIAIRWTQNFCLGFDHRTIDGADAGKFMAEFKKTLEGWAGDIG